jgi:hypothetical protein
MDKEGGNGVGSSAELGGVLTRTFKEDRGCLDIDANQFIKQ